METDTDDRRSRAVIVVAVGAVVVLMLTTLALTYVRRRLINGSRVALSVTIDRPVHEVFAFVSDARNALRWLPVAIERRKVSEGEVGLGTRFEGSDRIGGRMVSHSQEIVAFEPDARVTTRISGPAWSADYDIRFEPLDEATRLTVEITGQASGPYRLMDLVPDALMTRSYTDAYARLKEMLETGRADLARIPVEPELEIAPIASDAGASV